MKRMIALLLVVLTLCGCSSATPSSSLSGDSTNAADPAVVTLPDTEDYPKGTGLVVKFEMGAEFEMVLNMFHAVLEVNPLNQAGEALLAAIEPSGSYRSAMETILAESQKQGLLNDDMVINLAAYEVGDGAWTIAGHTLLTWPIENYRKSCGVMFTCQLAPAGDFMDPDSYAETFTRDDGDYTTTVCYNQGRQDMDYRIYDNGDYCEWYYFSLDEFASSSYYADGSSGFYYHSPVIDHSYTVYPDGSVEYVQELFDENGNRTRRTSLTQDGHYYDDFYQDGLLVRSIYNDPSGQSYDQTYFENGNIASAIGETPDGSSYETEYYENGTIKRSFTRNPDGTTYEESHYENGMIRSNSQTHADGTYSQYEYYETGVIKHTLTRYTDGKTSEQYYDENGNPVDTPTES